VELVEIGSIGAEARALEVAATSGKFGVLDTSAIQFISKGT
jgi:hypothetical protein